MTDRRSKSNEDTWGNVGECSHTTPEAARRTIFKAVFALNLAYAIQAEENSRPLSLDIQMLWIQLFADDS